MRSTTRSALRPFVLAFAALCPLVLPAGVRAISQSHSISGPSIPWWERIVHDGIALQVDVEPLEPARRGVLREKDPVAFRFRVFDVATGQPLAGLKPAAWVAEVPEDEAFDPERCAEEAQRVLGGTPLERLGETSRPGTYETVARLRRGRHEVVFLLGSPRIVHCFQVDVRPARFAWRGSRDVRR